MASRLVNDPADTILRVAMPLDQLTIALGFLKRVEVLALDILDERQFGRGRIIDLANDRWDRMLPRPLRGSPPPLARDDHVIFPVRPQQDRLEHATLANGFG